MLYQPNSIRTREDDIMVDGNKLNSVLEFTYLGSTIPCNGGIDDEIQRRMANGSASFGRLCQILWNNGSNSDQKVSPVDWTGYQTKFSTLNCLLVAEREGAYIRFKDTIKRYLKMRDRNIDSWTSHSQKREKWRATVK